MKVLFVLISTIYLFACTSDKRTETSSDYNSREPAVGTESISVDSTYGYSEKKPIKVGGGLQTGAENEARYLRSLVAQNGQEISFKRLGSCCPFKTPNSVFAGLLDMYEITYEGLETPLVLYLNYYDLDELKPPVGFIFKSNSN